MDMLEKVEKLRTVADVTYEEAKEALEEANGDILDAMIILEKKGKTAGQKSSSYSTKYEEDKDLPVVVAEAGNEKNSKCDKAKDFGEKMRRLWQKLCVNYLVVSRKEEQIIKMPIWLFLVIVIVGIEIVPILIVVSLFFGFRYNFEGQDDLTMVNDISNKSTEFADSVVTRVKDEYNKL